MILDLLFEQMENNGLVVGFCFATILLVVSKKISAWSKGRLHHSAIAICFALVLAGVSGAITGGNKGLADVSIFSGLALFGGSMLRDFTIVSTVFGVRLSEIKKCGVVGIVSLVIGILLSFAVGVFVAVISGYTSAIDITTIGAGCVTFVVGPVTGGALGASSAVIAISIAAGLVKSVATMVLTPIMAKRVGITTPKAAMVFGGLLGTTSGVAAALAATDETLVPYGAMTVTFYTGMGCLLCPSLLYGLVRLLF